MTRSVYDPKTLDAMDDAIQTLGWDGAAAKLGMTTANLRRIARAYGLAITPEGRLEVVTHPPMDFSADDVEPGDNRGRYSPRPMADALSRGVD